MKKLAVAIMLLVYFTVTTGFVVSVHYCMGRLASVKLGYAAGSDCGRCGMAMKKATGCCTDDVRLVKMHADHNLAKTVVADFSTPALAPIASQFFPLPVLSATPLSSPLAHGPPLGGQDTHLRNCVFRL